MAIRDYVMGHKTVFCWQQ